MGIEKLRKRDGRLVDFDEGKIAAAINRAFEATYKPGHEQIARELARDVVSVLEVEGLESPEVEHVQDIVEKVLMDSGYVQTAKAYILYRNERSRAREMNTQLMKAYEDITFAHDEETEHTDSAMRTMLRYGSEGAEQFCRMFLLKPEHAKAHQEGDLYIHDLDFYALTTASCQINLRPLLAGGFSAGGCFLPPPDGISDCAALACAAIQANQNDQHGGQSIADFDYTMADGVRKTYARLYLQNLSKFLLPEEDADLTALLKGIMASSGLSPQLAGDGAYQAAELPLLAEHCGDEQMARKAQTLACRWAERETDRAVYEAMQSLLRTLNAVGSRCGARLPLSAVNYGCDTSPEGRMVVKNLLLATEASLGQGEALRFPAQFFRVKEGISCSPGDPNYDLLRLACRCAAKCSSPAFAFLDAPCSQNYYDPNRSETEIAYTGRRARIVRNVFDPAREQCGGRGILSATSLNLPRAALKAKGDLDAFFDELDSKMDLCIDQLKDRFEIQAGKKAAHFPFLMGQGVWMDSGSLSREDEIREVLQHGAMAVGFVGLAEALTALTGEHHGQSPRSQRLGLEIVARMRARVDEECTKTGLNFALLAPAAQDLGRRFAQMDKARFGELPGVTDRDSYTDSFHLPADFPISASEKIHIEAPYHALTNGGHITWAALAEGEDPEALLRSMKEAGVGCGAILSGGR